MGNETPIEIPRPKVEMPAEKFTMSKEDFRAMMKEQLAEQEAAKIKDKDKPVNITPETDSLKQKIADLEKQLSTRTTATRDNMVTDGMPGSQSKPTSPKTKAIRQRIIGMGVIKTLAQTDSEVHIHYVNEQNLPPEAR